MSKCVYCHERKGKRPCPGYPPGGSDGPICSLCCGEHRMVRITCPSDCAYLEPNSEYQERRIGERFAQERKEFYKELLERGGEKAVALFNLVEVVTFSHFHDRPDGQDGEVIAAIQALRRTLSPLHIPAGPSEVFAEELKKEYEAFAKQQDPQGPAALDQQVEAEVLERALKFVTVFSGTGLQSHRFLTGLIGFIRTQHPRVAEQFVKQQEGGRIVLPGQFTPGQVEPPGHLHPGHAHHAHEHRHR